MADEVIYCSAWGDSSVHMARAMSNSALHNAPGTEVRLDTTPPPDDTPPLLWKMLQWQSAVDHAERPLILADADILFLRDPAPGFDTVDDVGLTYREWKVPVNTGVVFVRPGDQSREFFETWVGACRFFHQPGPGLWAGRRLGGNAPDQSAALYAADAHPDHVSRLECEEFNSVEQTWSRLDRAKIVHVKTRPRRLIAEGEKGNPRSKDPARKIVAWFRRYESD